MKARFFTCPLRCPVSESRRLPSICRFRTSSCGNSQRSKACTERSANLKPQFARWWPEEQPIAWEVLIEQLDRAVQIPSFANAWLFPIRTRIDMITIGIRTPVGVKVMGPKLE